MTNVKVTECKNGRIRLDLYDLNCAVNHVVHTYTNNGNVEIRVAEECGKIIDGFNWKNAAFYDTKEEAMSAADQALAVAEKIAKGSKVELLQAKLDKLAKSLASYREAGNEKKMEQIAKNISRTEQKLAALM